MSSGDTVSTAVAPTLPLKDSCLKEEEYISELVKLGVNEEAAKYEIKRLVELGVVTKEEREDGTYYCLEKEAEVTEKKTKEMTEEKSAEKKVKKKVRKAKKALQKKEVEFPLEDEEIEESEIEEALAVPTATPAAKLAKALRVMDEKLPELFKQLRESGHRGFALMPEIEVKSDGKVVLKIWFLKKTGEKNYIPHPKPIAVYEIQ